MADTKWLASLSASALIAATAGCDAKSETDRPGGATEVHLGLKLTAPVQAGTADAKSALAKGDRRLIAVYGFTTELPGYSGAPSDYEPGFRVVQDTGDVVRGPVHRAYIDKARRYALAYNRAILSDEPR